jgi:cardiolipin synthase
MAIDLGEWIVPLIVVFDLVAIVYIIFFERRDPGNATLWLLVLIFLPFLGFIFYLLFGQHYFTQKRFALRPARTGRCSIGSSKSRRAPWYRPGP